MTHTGFDLEQTLLLKTVNEIAVSMLPAKAEVHGLSLEKQIGVSLSKSLNR